MKSESTDYMTGVAELCYACMFFWEQIPMAFYQTLKGIGDSPNTKNYDIKKAISIHSLRYLTHRINSINSTEGI